MHMYSSEIEKFSFAGKTIPKLMSRGDLATKKGHYHTRMTSKRLKLRRWKPSNNATWLVLFALSVQCKYNAAAGALPRVTHSRGIESY